MHLVHFWCCSAPQGKHCSIQGFYRWLMTSHVICWDTKQVFRLFLPVASDATDMTEQCDHRSRWKTKAVRVIVWIRGAAYLEPFDVKWWADKWRTKLCLHRIHLWSKHIISVHRHILGWIFNSKWLQSQTTW